MNSNAFNQCIYFKVRETIRMVLNRYFSLQEPVSKKSSWFLDAFSWELIRKFTKKLVKLLYEKTEYSNILIPSDKTQANA